LTPIELEATESVAMISCRKYLPEESTRILGAFSDYLDRVIRQCRSTADLRESEFARLKVLLSQADQVTVVTAGALRSSTHFVEELPLIDQPRFVAKPRNVEAVKQGEERSFHGVLRLSAHETKALARCIMIIDAVIRHRDHSSATFQAWRGEVRSQPFKRLLKQNGGSSPVLHTFVFETKNSGVTLDFEAALVELVVIWSGACKMQLDLEHTRSLIDSYFPVALGIKQHEQMAAIFETARRHVSQSELGRTADDATRS
jgi:hypothetical protein